MGLNIAAMVFLYSLPKSCRLDGGSKKGLLAILPSFLTGFACCVPSFIIPLASLLGSLSIYIIKLRVVFIPLSIFFLGLGLFFGIKRIPEDMLKPNEG